MHVFEMVVWIVVVACATGVISEYLKTKRKLGGTSNEDLDDAMDRIDELEERVRVLERLVTDDKYHLSREIDGLKDA
ncbi:MAG: hypothetical protein ACFHX7_21475 [Pseudomonadota bacterium]